MHGIDLTTQMDIFYHAMNYASKGIIDASCYGAFKIRSAEEEMQLIEDLSKCNYKAPSEAPGSNNRLRGSGLIEMNRMTAIKAKLDAVMNKLGSNERRMHTAHEVATVDEGERRKSAEEGQNHEGSYQVGEAQYLNANRSYTFEPNLNLPTHYTLALRNHENFSYGGGAQQGQRPGQNMHNIMPHLGSNNNNSSSRKQDRHQIIRGRGDLIPLKTKCLLSWGKTKGC